MSPEQRCEGQIAISAPKALDGSGADEPQLVAQARQGSRAAVEALVDRYQARVFRLAQNITANYQDAEEVVQSAFAKAFGSLATFRGESRFYTWLLRITINEALLKIRGRRLPEVSEASIDDDSEDCNHRTPWQLADWSPSPEQIYSQEELRRILETSIGGLAPAYRVVFQLRDVDGLSTEETAHALDLPITTVKTRLRRARLQLRDLLDPYFRAAGALRDQPRVRDHRRQLSHG
jgi:RNA polymerase sigma-70 factor, ECF subfamily